MIGQKALAAETGKRVAELCAKPGRIESVLEFVQILAETTPAQIRVRERLRANETNPRIEAILDFVTLVDEGATMLRGALDVAASEGVTISDRALALRKDPKRARASFAWVAEAIIKSLDPATRDDALDAYALAFFGIGAGAKGAAA